MKFPEVGYEELRPAPLPGRAIRAKRKALNIEETTIAASAGMSIYEYDDLESHPADFYAVVPLVMLWRVVTALGLTLNEMLQIRSCVEALGADSLRARRVSLGQSVEELSDQVGILEEAIVAAESDPSTLQSWRLDPLLMLAYALDLQLSCVLDLALKDVKR